MAIAHNTIQTNANAGATAGEQTGALTAGLANGSYVVAWTSTIPGNTTEGNVQFRIFDASGNPVGGIQTASAQPANDEKLQDIIANGDGSFTIAYTSTGTAAATAPAGYGATGAVTQIGVIRSFSAAGAAQGAETPVFLTAGEEIVNSMKLVAVNSTTVQAYFTQKDATTNAADIGRTGNIATSGAAATTEVLVKEYDGVANAIPSSELRITDVERQSAGNDLIVADGVMFFSATPDAETTVGGSAGRSVVKVQDGLFLRLDINSANSSLAVTAFAGTGDDAGAYALSGGAGISIPGVTSGTVSHTRAEALGGGRFLFAWASSQGLVAGVVFNANTMAFEGSGTTLLSGVLGDFGLDVLADGRVVVSGTGSVGQFGGNEAITRILDPRDGSFNSDNNDKALSFANDTAGLRVDLAFFDNNTGPAAPFAPGINQYVHVIGGGGADALYGNSGANTFKGGGGNDYLNGREGVDELFGGAGDDTIDGGAGSDIMDGGANNDLMNGGTGFDTLLGGDGNDAMAGGADGDILNGGTGDDQLRGGAGDDRLHGEAGNDRMQGGAGDDTLLGGDNNDLLSGGDGDDSIDGGAGNDIVSGGSGANIINGGLNTDTLSYAGVSVLGTTGVLADLDGSGSSALPGSGLVFLNEDVILNIENVIGSNGDDFIFGTAGVNALNGGAGNDVLYGRSGADNLTGGAGGDFFVYEASSEGNDRILDFTVGSDKFLIKSSAFAGINAGDIAASFVANATGAATSAGPQFTFDNAGAGAGQLRFDSNGTTAGGATAIAILTFTTAGGLAGFSAGDFDFI